MTDLGAFLVALAFSFVGSVLLLLTKRWHLPWSGDFQDSGVQKHHVGVTPRIGLLPLLLGLTSVLLVTGPGGFDLGQEPKRLLTGTVVASLPIAMLGLWEDVTKGVRPRTRLLGACASAALGMVVFDVRLGTVPIAPFGDLATLAVVGIPLTVLMVSGFVNAMNIVDGLNGLAGGIALLMLTATTGVAVMVGDAAVATLCIMVAGAVAGFLLVNYPRGSIFLGDGGAYLIGFAMVQIWILLVSRNPGEVSPWVIMAMAVHPTTETIFSMYRRRFRVRRQHAMAPDRLHLHTLLYRRWARPLLNTVTMPAAWMPNALAASAILLTLVAPLALTLVAPQSDLWGFTVMLAMVFVYLAAFQQLCRFRFLRRRQGAVPAAYSTVDTVGEPAMAADDAARSSSAHS